MLGAAQREAAAAGGLRAMGEAYVRFALAHPQRFRLMFGGAADDRAASARCARSRRRPSKGFQARSQRACGERAGRARRVDRRLGAGARARTAAAGDRIAAAARQGRAEDDSSATCSARPLCAGGDRAAAVLAVGAGSAGVVGEGRGAGRVRVRCAALGMATQQPQQRLGGVAQRGFVLVPQRLGFAAAALRPGAPSCRPPPGIRAHRDAVRFAWRAARRPARRFSRRRARRPRRTARSSGAETRAATP